MGQVLDQLNRYRGTEFEGDWPTIVEMYNINAKRFPDRYCFTAFNPERHSLTYAEVSAHLQRISNYLLSKGVEKGDRIGLDGKNSIQWALAYLAILFAGATVVPFDNQMHSERIEELGAFCGISFFFADRHALDAFDRNTPWFSSLKGTVCLDEATGDAPNIDTVEAKKRYRPTYPASQDTAAILFTSGTTGNEKGAILTHDNIVSDVYQASTVLHVDEHDVFYALLPLHHSYCCTSVLLETIRHGAECVFAHEIAVSRMITDLNRGHITVFMGIPLLYNKVLTGMMKAVRKKGPLIALLVHTMMFVNGFCKKYWNRNPLRKTFNNLLLGKVGLAHNRVCISGAGPLAPKVFRQYQQLGIDFVQGYGLTEASPILTLNPIEHFKVDSVGKCFPLVDMKIAHPDANGIGEVCVKGPNVTSGYYRDEIRTAQLFDDEGYLKTGDLGSMDKENYLYLKGRAKNLIVTEGGKNVYPEEIEDLFQLYPAIDQILVRGYRAKKDMPGESIEVVIHPDEEYRGQSPEKTIDDIVAEVNKQLVGYKKITKVTIVDEPMAMTSTKKIKRNKVHI